ncbi:13170_t:CDS:2, partial [Cetraspora pellucida]
MVEFNDDMFNDNIEDEELDANYIFDTENLDDLLQFNKLEDDEYDYDIDQVINASM